MSNENRINEIDHLEYILEKEKKTLTIWDEIMFKRVSFSDFEKSSSIKTDTESSHNAKPTEDESTTDQNVLDKKPIKDSKKDKRFPRGRVEQ